MIPVFRKETGLIALVSLLTVISLPTFQNTNLSWCSHTRLLKILAFPTSFGQLARRDSERILRNRKASRPMSSNPKAEGDC